MANEYLRRTPTSTGNRKVFTWSGWVKLNYNSNNNIIFSFGNSSSVSPYETRLTVNTNFKWRATINGNGSGIGFDIVFSPVVRDTANWTHVLFVADTSNSIVNNRLILYINGIRLTGIDNTGNLSSQAIDSETNVNTSGQIATIGAASYSSTGYVKTEYSDVFFVDGQALTPDVFGFYKDGNGYISAGSTQATDFRPGQWVPKAPRVIKAQIERNGGFGVNGFYLPMNDSSNFGADFHTTPNSIITLKGEDLPQPRNGAPETTDAYVSQLREDPYADNLVLAIPGIVGGASTGYGDYSADIKGSGSNKTVTANGNAGVAVTASYYGSALSFDGTGDYLSVADNSDFGFGTGDFTIEYWIHHNGSSSSAHTFDLRPSGNEDSVTAFYVSSTQLRIYLNAADKITVSSELKQNQWTHHAIVRNGSTLTFYQNGVAAGINTTSGDTLRSSAPAVIGAKRDFSSSLNGYLQDFRVYKGVAKYKGGFDVPKPYTPVGIATWRAVPDTTANNFATLNAVQINRPSSITVGNLSWSATTAYTYGQGTIAVPKTGKWVFEGRFNSNTSNNNYNSIGVGTTNPAAAPLNVAGNYGINDAGPTFGQSFIQNGVRQGSITLPAGTIIQVLIDRDNNQMTFVKDGILQTGTGSTVTIPSDADLYTMIGEYNVSGQINFGQNPTFSGQTTAGTFTDSNGKGLFKYEPPSGFLALCEDNLPTPAIKNPGEHFKTVLWTGDGNSGRSITGIGFTPDLVWYKARSSAFGHGLFDSIRGALRLSSDGTGAENTDQGVISFNSDGFSLGNHASGNTSGTTMVAWCWKAGAGTTSTNTDGSIQSVVSVNQDAGFSIVSWTSDGTNLTVGHGLNKVPSFIIQKQRDATANWTVYHKDLAATEILELNTTNAKQTSSDFGNTRPTSSVLSSNTTGVSGRRIIAYCWAEIEGFSKFGSYVGNASTDGPFVYTGGRPAFVMLKASSTTGNWCMIDNARNSTNPTYFFSVANSSNAGDDTGGALDFLSNGFKLRLASSNFNGNGVTYIYACFMESPFSYSNSK